jgi:hypothetical protein
MYSNAVELISSSVFPPSVTTTPLTSAGSVGPPVFVGRSRDLTLSLDVTDVLPDPAASSPTITLDVLVETSSSRAAKVWRTLGAFPTQSTVGSTPKTFARADAWIRARYVLGSATSFGFSVSGDAQLTAVASQTVTTSGVSSPVELAQYRTAKLCLDVSAASGALPTLTATIETAPMASASTWRTVGAFSPVIASSSQDVRFHSLDRFIRVRWTVGGTSPSFTFSVAGIAVFVLASPSDRQRLGVLGNSLFPSKSVDDVADAIEVATTLVLPYYHRWQFPLRSWGDDTRKACVSIADFLLLTSRGVEPGDGENAYVAIYRDFVGEPPSRLGWLDLVRKGEITPSDIIDSEDPEIQDTIPRVVVSSLPLRRWGRGGGR